MARDGAAWEGLLPISRWLYWIGVGRATANLLHEHSLDVLSGATGACVAAVNTSFV